MASLKALRNRVTSIKSTRKLTKAIQLVAVAKLRRAQDMAEKARAYENSLDTIISHLISSGVDFNQFNNHKPVNKKLLLAFSADRGLCGPFNNNVVKEVQDFLAKHDNTQLVTFGAYLTRVFKNKGIIKSFDKINANGVSWSTAQLVSNYIMELWQSNNFDEFHIISTKFVSIIRQDIKVKQIIPFCCNTQLQEEEGLKNHNYIYESNLNHVASDLLTKSIFFNVYQGLVESYASEQGASVNAMENATRNADTAVDKLTILCNRTRQAIITNELIEIISGAEAI